MKKLTPAEMIDNILANFDFEKVERAMHALDWKWGSGLGFKTPDQAELYTTAKDLLEHVVRILSTDLRVKPHQPCHVATGGFKASGCLSKKGNIRELELDFILTGWESERDSYE